MRVTIIFEYADVDEANGAEADAIIERLTDACEGMKWDYNASNVWVDDATCEED